MAKRKTQFEKECEAVLQIERETGQQITWKETERFPDALPYCLTRKAQTLGTLEALQRNLLRLEALQARLEAGETLPNDGPLPKEVLARIDQLCTKLETLRS